MSERTIRCKTAPTPVMAKSFALMADTFADACNFILVTALKENLSNKMVLQQKTYREVRENFALSANLAIQAIRRVSTAMVLGKKTGHFPQSFAPTSISYDARIFAYREKDETVSLTTMDGRIHVPLVLGKYQRDALKGKKPTAATVVRQKKRWDIHITIEEEDPEPKGGKAMGVDLGIRNTAVTSEGGFHPGQARQAFKKLRCKVRASLQSRNTQKSKRTLRRLSGRETRRITWENHNLSKLIVAQAKDTGCGVIRMERLTGIRLRCKIYNKHTNRMMSGWSFGQLQTFTEYKAIRAGLLVEYVEPAYSSQTCAKCGQRGVRRGDVFSCITCGADHADVNASHVIAAGGAALVNRPEW